MKFFQPNVEKMARKGDVPGLLKALDNEDSDIWIPAAWALAATGDERAFYPLRAKVQHWGPARISFAPSPFPDALGAFVALGDERVAGSLVALFSASWSEDARGGAAHALVALGEPAVAPVAEQLRPDKNPAFGASLAAEVLKRIGSPSALPAVTVFLREFIAGREVRHPAGAMASQYQVDTGCIEAAIGYLATQDDPEAAALLADLLTYLTAPSTKYSMRGGSLLAIEHMTTACTQALYKVRGHRRRGSRRHRQDRQPGRRRRAD